MAADPHERGNALEGVQPLSSASRGDRAPYAGFRAPSAGEDGDYSFVEVDVVGRVSSE